jgi:hypothetical protein
MASVTNSELDAASSPLDGRRAVRIGVTYLLVQAAFHLLALPFAQHAPHGTSPAIFEIPATFAGQAVAVFIAWRMTLSTCVGSPDPDVLRAIGWSRSSPRVVAGGAAVGGGRSDGRHGGIRAVSEPR